MGADRGAGLDQPLALDTRRQGQQTPAQTLAILGTIAVREQHAIALARGQLARQVRGEALGKIVVAAQETGESDAATAPVADDRFQTGQARQRQRQLGRAPTAHTVA